MNVIVSKKALVGAIVESLDDRDLDSPEFERISVEDNEPIKPVEMMSTQLVEEMPPVDDPEFIPQSINELMRSAYVISKEVPQSQIEYFYRRLHELLDTALDREAESDADLQVENLKSIIGLLFESPDMKDLLLKRAIDRAEGGEDSYDIAVDLINNYSEFEEYDPVDLQAMIDNADMQPLSAQEPEQTTAGDQKEEPAELEDDDSEISEDDIDRLLKSIGESPSEEELANKIVDIILKREMHTVVLTDPETGNPEMVPVVIVDPQTGDFKLSEKEMRVIASENYGWEIIKQSLEHKDINTLFEKLSQGPGGPEKAYMWVYSNLNSMLGKEGNPVSSDLAAEMYANQIADTIGKYGESVRDQLVMMADEIDNTAGDITAQIGRGSDSLSITTSNEEMSAALRMVADQRLEPPRRGRPKIYGDEEPREEMTSEMRKKIRAERRKAELDLEFEPGKLHLSPKALRAMMDKIAADLGINLGNVRNVVYDDLKVYGLPAADLRKMIHVDKLPGGREKIPFTYDPLRIQASEKIVEKLYDMYVSGLKSYVKEVIQSGDEEDRDVGEAYADLFFGQGGLYQPGLDGYVNLQAQVGGPTVDNPDSVDINDPAFITKRKAYDFIQEFVDQVAKEWLDPQSPEYKQAKEGGMRAFLNSMVNDESFSDVNSRADMEKIIKAETDGIENQFDEEKIKKIIDVVFDKAPRRTRKYIDRVKKELGIEE